MFHSIGHIDWLINLGHQFKITDALANSGTELMGVDHAGKSPAVLKGSNYSLDSNKQLSLALLAFFCPQSLETWGQQPLCHSAVRACLRIQRGPAAADLSRQFAAPESCVRMARGKGIESVMARAVGPSEFLGGMFLGLRLQGSLRPRLV